MIRAHRTQPVPWCPLAGALCLLLAATLSPRAAAEGFAAPAIRHPDLSEGELLLGELNCVSCHAADPAVASRLASRGAPGLGRQGLRLTPQWLTRWLAEPASTDGSAMPDPLHGLAPVDRAAAVDGLVHYLVSIQPEGPADAAGADPARLNLGRELYHQVGCVACHGPQERRGDLTPEAWDRARAGVAPLRDLARKYPVTELAAFLRDPVRHRPGGRMPASGLNANEALAVATYLLRDQVPALTGTGRPLRTIPGFKWEYFEGNFNGVASLDRMKPVAEGEADTFETRLHRREGGFALRFTGVIEVPSAGEYTFWLNSDDGSALDIDGRRVVLNDGDHAPVERSGRVRLDAGPHTFELRFYQNGGGWELGVRWAGPGFDRQPVPASALKRYGEPMEPLDSIGFAVDPARVARGREWFGRLACAACHQVDDPAGKPATGRAAPALAALATRATSGCLADTPPAGVPRFHLTSEQRTALRTAVARAADLAVPLDPARAIRHTFTRLQCHACHARDGVGGPEATGRDPWFTLVGEADLGDEGRLPAHLDAVGGKLRKEWLTRVLAEGTKVRPYMATRMPVFGGANVGHLPGLLEAADVRPDARPEPESTPRDAKFGHRLVGRDGLSCVACHTFAGYGSLGIPGLALDRMHERLRYDWFRRYLPDPAALRPGTRMPSFWPGGQAVNTELLDGDTDAQIRSLFAWMKDGAKADVPAGLIRARQELVAETEPVLYRNFIEGAGPRAIGVGYPEHANLAFDANQMRLALAWQGAFIDMSRHATDRGVGFEPPLGDRVIRFPDGPAFAVLSAADAPWPAATVRPAGQRFLGYRLDAARRPVFRYAIGSLEVQDAPVPRVDEVDIILDRTLTFTGPAPEGRLWFRAAAGEIRPQADGSFLVDGQFRIRCLGGGPAVVVGRELRVPVDPTRPLNVQITW